MIKTFFLLIALCALATAGPAADFNLRELVRKVERQYSGDSSQAEMEMTVKTGHWERHLRMESWSLGRERFLVRILEPKKEQGVATLKVEREVWNYLPKVDRVIKVPASMMGGSWMGSHITNDDLVDASHVDRDYTFGLLEETDTLYRIECLPKPDAAVVWGKIVYTIGKEPLVPHEVVYFDEEMVEVRRIIFDDVQTVSGRTIPLRLRVQPRDQPQERTVMTYHDLDYDVELDPSFFSLRNLKKR